MKRLIALSFVFILFPAFVVLEMLWDGFVFGSPVHYAAASGIFPLLEYDDGNGRKEICLLYVFC